jgi:iron complex transport system substrate-binding protein
LLSELPGKSCAVRKRIVDRLLNEVTVRVVSLLASGTEIVCALDAGRALVGRSHECDNPAWVSSPPACTRPAFDVEVSSGEIDAEVRRRLAANEPLYHVDTELIERLQPDLLITQVHCHVCAVTPDDIQRDGCIPLARQVVALSAGNIDGIYEGVGSVARALGLEDAGRALVAKMKGDLYTVTDSVAGRAAPTLVMLEWTDPLFAMGNWGPELVEAANGRLLLGEKGQFSHAVQWKEVRAADPDFLIVAPCGFTLERSLREVALFEALPGWFEMKAVRNGRVAFADGNKYFNRSGTTIVETAQMLAEILHGRVLEQGWRGTAWLPYHEARAAT